MTAAATWMKPRQWKALGCSRGGLTTTTHMAADTLGRPIRFILTAGQSGDAPAAPALLDGFRPRAVLPDNAYDSNTLRAIIADLRARLPPPPTGREKL